MSFVFVIYFFVDVCYLLSVICNLLFNCHFHLLFDLLSFIIFGLLFVVWCFGVDGRRLEIGGWRLETGGGRLRLKVTLGVGVVRLEMLTVVLTN